MSFLSKLYDSYVDYYWRYDITIVIVSSVSLFIFNHFDLVSSINSETLLTVVSGSSLSLAGFVFAAYSIFISLKWSNSQQSKKSIPLSIPRDQLSKYIPSEQELKKDKIKKFFEGQNFTKLLMLLKEGILLLFAFFFIASILLLFIPTSSIYLDIMVLTLFIWLSIVTIRTIGISLDLLNQIF